MPSEQVIHGWKPETEIDKNAVFEQLDRILADPAFAKSKRYPSLLKFVVQRTLDGEEDSLKERILGIEIFERSPDYDTTEDPIVRVTAAKIRKRISEYYENPAHQHELRIDLPAGSYIPVFQRGAANVETPAPLPLAALIEPTLFIETPAPIPKAAAYEMVRPKWQIFAAGAVLLLLIAAVVAGFTVWRGSRNSSLTALWKPLLTPPLPMLICIADEPRGKIVLMDAANPVSQEIPGNIPSIVDVENIFPVTDLTSMIASHGQRYNVQGQRRTTISDLSRGPAILMGAYNNVWTLRLTRNLRFHFANDMATRDYWIEDARSPGERKWLRDLKMQSTETGKDYAIVARFTPAETEQPTIVIAGLGHAANIAAVQFVLSANFLTQLDQTGSDWRKKNFQAVVETSVVGGHGGAPNVVATHTW